MKSQHIHTHTVRRSKYAAKRKEKLQDVAVACGLKGSILTPRRVTRYPSGAQEPTMETLMQWLECRKVDPFNSQILDIRLSRKQYSPDHVKWFGRSASPMDNPSAFQAIARVQHLDAYSNPRSTGQPDSSSTAFTQNL